MELMAIVAIVSILAVIALSAYSDYVVRAKVAEGVAFAAEAKTTVSEYYYSNKTMPTNNQQAGLPEPSDYSNHEFIHALRVRSNEPKPGTIEVEFDIPNLGAGNLLHLLPTLDKGIVNWICIPPDVGGIDINKVPPNCRGG